MKRSLSWFLYVCFVSSTQIGFSADLVEKSHSNAKIQMRMQEMVRPSQGVTGAEGPMGATGATGGFLFSSAEAVAVQEEAVNNITGETIVVPFSTLQAHSTNITLDSNNTFTLPSGVYKVHFRFSVRTGALRSAIKFTRMYLLLNGSTEVGIDWSAAYNFTSDGPPLLFSNAYFSGATILTVPANGTTAQFILTRGPAYSATDVDFNDPTSTENAVTCITFEKIDGV